MGYETWEASPVSPSSIDLDPKNPRLPGLPDGASQTQILDEMFNMGKVREMAKSISKSGFYPDQRLVVIRKDSGRGFIAIEGNRRLAACKALLAPEKIPEKHQRYIRRLSLAAQPFKASFEKLSVVIAPDRQSAMQLLASRHLNEAPVINWSRYAQGRFAINALSVGQDFQEIVEETGLSESVLRDSIQEARMFELFYGLSWTDEERDIIEAAVDKFPIEALRRILKSKVTQESFGPIEFGEDGWMTFSWEKERTEPLLKRLVYDAIPALSGDTKARLTSRTINDAEGVKKYIDELPEDIKPASSSTPISGRALIPETPTPPKVPQVSPSGQARKSHPKVRKLPKIAALPGDLTSDLKNDKAQALLDELQTIKPEELPYATGLLLRSLLEIALIARMKKVGTWAGCVSKHAPDNSTPPSLDKILKYAGTCSLTIADQQLRTSLSNQVSVPRVLLNLVAHNDQHVFIQYEARDVADKLTPLLRYLLSE